MKNAHSLYKLSRRNVDGKLTVVVQNTRQVIKMGFLHKERKQMDQSPLKMMFQLKSLEKTDRIGNKNTKTENGLLVEDMKHNLLSVIQLCYQGHKITFDP